MCSSTLWWGPLDSDHWCRPIDQPIGPSTHWFDPVGLIFSLACGLEPENNLSCLVDCFTFESDMYYNYRYIIHLHECCWDMLNCTYARSSGWLYVHWNYYMQLCCTKLIITHKYCWHYGVLGNQIVFPDWCSVLVILQSWAGWSVMYLYCLVLLVWFSNDRTTAVVTDLWQGIDCLGRIRWSMYVQ